MRQRLYFILPDSQTAKRIVELLLVARVPDKKIHLLSNDMNALQGLPVANVFQTTDLIHGLELGLILGGFTGIIAGIILSFIPGMILSSGALILIATFCGAIIGAWASGMIGSNLKNTRLKPYQQEIDQGQILLMVDVKHSRVDEIRELVHKHYSNTPIEGVEPSIPAFP